MDAATLAHLTDPRNRYRIVAHSREVLVEALRATGVLSELVEVDGRPPTIRGYLVRFSEHCPIDSVLFVPEDELGPARCIDWRLLPYALRLLDPS